MVNGTVKWFNSRKGYGFITSENQEVFVHYSNIETASDNEFKVLYEGDEVEFNIEQGLKGPEAKHVKIKKRAPRPEPQHKNFRKNNQGYKKKW